MKKIIILTFIVMMAGAATAQETKTRSEATNYVGLRYTGKDASLAIYNFELTYAYLPASWA